MKINIKMPERRPAGLHSKRWKVQSIQDQYRKYQEKLTDKFLFVFHGLTPLCLICRQTSTNSNEATLSISKIQWKLYAWQQTQKEINSTAYCFTFWAAKLYWQDNLYCRTFIRGIFWDGFWPRQNKHSQTQK